ncbi:MAG: DUF551 domain-containing protein [Phycisphaerales bacterium]|jgi:hypothetical protein
MAEWISTKDELPKERAKWETFRYLVYTERDGVQFGHYRGDNDWYNSLCGWDRHKIDVTHWMPLPELPKQELPKIITVHMHINDERMTEDDWINMVAEKVRNAIR